LLALPRMVRGHKSVVLDYNPLALQPPSPMPQLLELPLEGLNISSPDEVSSLDLSPDKLDKLDVVDPNSPLRHS
jgi:hypothetical protein